MADASRDVILASGSRFRKQMLEQAGLTFRVVPADLDESALSRDVAMGNPADRAAAVACRLAERKAEHVSRHFPSALVIGADQVLECEGEIFSKPGDRAAAAEQLARLAGRRHRLHSAVSLATGGVVTCSICDHVNMDMRPLTTAEIGRYLERVGPEICACVGAYQIEGLGAQLFDAIEGDYFTIIGLPLLPLLGELRARGIGEL